MVAGRVAELRVFATYGRPILIGGLVLGIAWPALAEAMRVTLGPLIVVLLALSAYRIGWRRAAGSVRDLASTLGAVIVLQVALPLALYAAFGAQTALLTALILTAASSSIAGSPNLVQMLGHDGSSALRLLVLGTALLPLTIVPTLWLLDLGSVPVAEFSVRMLLVIAGSCALGFAVRHWTGDPDGERLAQVDGASALTMGVIVIGLMSAVGPALRDEPVRLFWTLGAACALNIGMQVLTRLALPDTDTRAGVAVVAGNRNSAIYIAALPAEVIEPWWLFIGCYQVPMYLTPVLLRGLYARTP